MAWPLSGYMAALSMEVMSTVSVGDFHLARLVGYALIGEIVDDERMLELLTPWAGQRQRVVRLIEASGVSVPARGPRITVQDHRAI